MASPLACTSLCSPQSPVSVSSHEICCQLGWKSHPIIIIEGSFLPSVFVLKQRLHGLESSLHSYPINPCRVLCGKGGDFDFLSMLGAVGGATLRRGTLTNGVSSAYLIKYATPLSSLL